MIDMPLNALREYKGTNPCPADFNEFWDKAIEKMHNVNPNISLTESDFKCSFADCYDLYFTGVGNARVYAKILKPKHIKENVPVIMTFHGHHGNSGDWSDKLNFVAAGFIVAAMDCRGQAGKSVDTGSETGTGMYGTFGRGLDKEPEELLMHKIFLDAAELANILIDMPEVDKNRIYAWGGSQGAALTVAVAALEPRVSKIAIQYPFLSDYKRVWEMNYDYGDYDDIAKFLRSYDPLHKKQDEIFTKLGYIDVHNMATRVQAKTLMAISMMDTVCPPSTQFAVYNNLNCEKELELYYDYGHELYLPGFPDRIFNFLTGSEK